SKDASLTKEQALEDAAKNRPQPVWDVWIGKEEIATAYNDFAVGTYASKANEDTGYPTQKPLELLKRVITASCPRGGIVLDAFAGSGTTCKAAEQLSEELKCTWIGIDNSKFAIHTVRKRLIELNGKPKETKNEGVYKVRPFTVENMGYYQHLAFFAPLTVKINKVVDGKETMIELAGVEVDIESFLESQKPDRREELKKWLEQEKSWQSFVDFWAIDWDYDDLKDDLKEPVFENEWQSFRKRKGKKVVEDLVFKAFHKYEKPGEYIIAIKVTDVFGNDGIKSFKVVIK
ncbi:MAG TPA: site-specific DNA-methyltransferase, partial [Thermodesulfobacteriota bacterium]|nr:site-specific DNA-methyltransferase [Thermodesulfobacteriota bacterium]